MIFFETTLFLHSAARTAIASNLDTAHKRTEIKWWTWGELNSRPVRAYRIHLRVYLTIFFCHKQASQEFSFRDTVLNSSSCSLHTTAYVADRSSSEPQGMVDHPTLFWLGCLRSKCSRSCKCTEKVDNVAVYQFVTRLFTRPTGILDTQYTTCNPTVESRSRP